MLNREQIDFFKRNGYILIPNVLKKEEVDYLRNRIMNHINNKDFSNIKTNKVIEDPYELFPDFIGITLKSEVIDVIKCLLGQNPVLMPETAIHIGFYTGWHKDTTNINQAGLNFHESKDYLMVEAGFYLQDNDELGGGLVVMEGSHLTKDPYITGEHYKVNFFERIKNKIFKINEDNRERINPYKHKIVNIPSKAGDLVIFNFKTNHRASRPLNVSIDEIPSEKRKIAFFNAFSINNSTAKEYLEYICNRNEPFYKNIKNRKVDPNLYKLSKDSKFEII